MVDFRVAVKALILNNKNEVLLVKRSLKDNIAAGGWEVPGGRLELGENPFEGLKREVLEEINIPIEVEEPVNVRHFTNSDNVIITMIIFKCKSLDNKIKLIDGELSEFSWESLKKAKKKISKYFLKELELLEKIIKV